jgi:hypothetical protein
MRLTYLFSPLLVSLLLGCAPESMQAVTPRPAAHPDVPREGGVNHADDADQRLRSTSDQAAHVQDILEEPVHMQDEPVYIIEGNRDQ